MLKEAQEKKKKFKKELNKTVESTKDNLEGKKEAIVEYIEKNPVRSVILGGAAGLMLGYLFGKNK